MALIGQIVVAVRAQTDQFSKGLASAKSMLSGFGSAMNQVGIGALREFGAQLFSSGVDALQSATSAAMEHIDTQSKLASTLNIGLGEFQTWSHAAELAGLSQEDLGKGITKLQGTIGEIRAGLGDGGKDLAAYGVSLEEIAGAGGGGASLKEAVSQLSKIEDKTQRIAAAKELFGKMGAGTGFQSLLADGTDGIDEITSKLTSYGVILTDVQGKQVEMANDSITELQTALGGVANQLSAQVAPFITAAATAFTDWAAQGSNVTSIISTGLEWIAGGIGIVADVIHTAKLGFMALGGIGINTFSLIVQGVTALAQVLETVLNAIPGVEVSFTSSLTAINEDVKKKATEYNQGLWDEFLKEPPSTGIKQMFSSIKDESRKAAEAMLSDSANATRKMTEDDKKKAKSIDDLIQKLHEQEATVGMTTAQTEVFRLKELGASEAIIKEAQALQESIKKKEEKKKHDEELANKAKQLIEQNLTPLEKFEKDVAEIGEMFNKGLINETQLDRALKSAGNKGGEETKLAGALDFGSSAARSLVLKNQNPIATPMNKLAESAKEALVEAKKQTEYLYGLYQRKPSEENLYSIVG